MLSGEYTTAQNRLDSQVPVAVAALKRRQIRESVEATAADSSASNQHVFARKLIAALIYNLTNHQEIAGPLAALYIYCGSCCYSSGKRTTLPLGDVIRQLMTSDDYTCNLVNDADEAQ
ncbi:hypothetical protein PHMEG_00011578 [Phytophthora megakarya]|uniref:Uncharacterized protein n=1 Tax=Phytophthora megakarya TaxID=4795 RepID=A0A225WCY9_9STRA|nr:hypothetical protein PHMEG_00011578 [Phytophthora megakarya]